MRTHRPAVAYLDRIERPRRSTLRVRCTLPDQHERPVVLVLRDTDADTLRYHARRFLRGVRHGHR